MIVDYDDNYKYYDKSRSMYQLISMVDYGRLISPEPTINLLLVNGDSTNPSSSMTLLKIMVKILPFERSVKQNG